MILLDVLYDHVVLNCVDVVVVAGAVTLPMNGVLDVKAVVDDIDF